MKKTILAALLLATTDLSAQLRDVTTITRPPTVWVKSVNVPCFTSGGGTNPLVTAILPVCPGGFELRAKVILERPAPSPYIQINISSSDPTHAPAPPIRIHEGDTEGTSLILSKPVAANTPVTITAWTNTADTKTDTFTLVPPTVDRIDLSPPSVTAGTDPTPEVQGTITFNGPPAAANTIRAIVTTTLGTPNPSYVYLPLGAVSAPFVIKNLTTPVATTTPVTVTATSGTQTKQATFTTVPPVGGLSLNYSYCYVPCQHKFELWLNAPAPAGGYTFKIESSNPAVFQVPATVTLHQGQRMTTAFHAGVLQPAPTQTVTITSSHPVAGTSERRVQILPPPQGDFRYLVVSFFDQYGTPITKIPDANPVKMCVKIDACSSDDTYTAKCFLHEPANLALLVTNTNNSGVGREYKAPVDFPGDGALYPASWNRETTVCTQISGLANPGDYQDIKLMIDPDGLISEASEGNNDKTVRIYR